jgi:hypothetical protein
MVKTLKEFGQSTNLKLLRKQKSRLLQIVHDKKNKCAPKQHEAVEGIVSFLDVFQDLLVNSGDFGEQKVFGKRKERV